MNNLPVSYVATFRSPFAGLTANDGSFIPYPTLKVRFAQWASETLAWQAKFTPTWKKCYLCFAHGMREDFANYVGTSVNRKGFHKLFDELCEDIEITSMWVWGEEEEDK